jgi:hypothetical protein
LYRETELRASSGAVTPVTRPGISGVTLGQQGLRSVQVGFQTVQGADQYVFEFATQPNFQGATRRGPFYFQPTANSGLTSEPFDISREFANVPENGRVYVRVGARNSLDEPGPLSRDTPNGQDYVYSAIQTTFNKPVTPPPPPPSGGTGTIPGPPGN